ncbi:hypothetical protein ACP3V3_01790 [Vibrio sp. PNB22_3_1]
MSRKNKFRSKELKDNDGNKWRIKGDQYGAVWQKKIGRSWATWMGGIPNEIYILADKLSDSDYVACY